MPPSVRRVQALTHLVLATWFLVATCIVGVAHTCEAAGDHDAAGAHRTTTLSHAHKSHAVDLGCLACQYGSQFHSLAAAPTRLLAASALLPAALRLAPRVPHPAAPRGRHLPRAPPAGSRI